MASKEIVEALREFRRGVEDGYVDDHDPTSTLYKPRDDKEVYDEGYFLGVLLKTGERGPEK